MWRKACAIVAILQMGFLVVLNAYWYTLILKGLLKLMGCMKKNEKKDTKKV